jgi:hypothetical protein
MKESSEDHVHWEWFAAMEAKQRIRVIWRTNLNLYSSLKQLPQRRCTYNTAPYSKKEKASKTHTHTSKHVSMLTQIVNMFLLLHHFGAHLAISI